MADEITTNPAPKEAPVKRGPGNPAWVKGGPSPNPQGRPQDFGKLIRRTFGRDGAPLLDILWRIASGEMKLTETRLVHVGFGPNASVEPVEVDVYPSHKVIVDAAKMIIEHGWGKAPQTITVNHDSEPEAELDLAQLTPAELETWRMLHAKASAEHPIIDVTPSEPAE